jgi:hypothetical protein
MRENTFSLLDLGDTFFIDPQVSGPLNPPEVKIETPGPLYEIGYGDMSTVIPENEYKLMRSIIWTISLGIIAIGLVFVLWYFFKRYNNYEKLKAEQTASSKLINFMNNVNNTGYYSKGTASGIRSSVDCNDFNNCVITTQNGLTLYNCFTDDNGNEEWEGRRCELPLITPYYANIILMDIDSVISSLGITTASPKTYMTPSDVKQAISEDLGALYDLTDPGSNPGTYGTYILSGSHIDVTNTLLISNVIPFGQVTKSIMLFTNTPQNLFFGNGNVIINYDRDPNIAFLINTNGVNASMISTETGQAISVSFASPYSIFNPSATKINIKTLSSSVSTSSTFIPYTNTSRLNTTISVVN